MRVFHSPKDLPASLKGASLALGNFDGVHRGHRGVIEAAALACHPASDHGPQAGPVGVVTFEPHPRQLFRPEDPPFRIAPWPAKRRRLRRSGIDFTLAIRFDKIFSQVPADRFLDDWLVGPLQPRHITVGYDFSFGHRRSGNASLLRQHLAALDIGFTEVSAITGPDGEIYSSTRVRELLRMGHPREAADQLGSPWEIEAIVQDGDKRGRLLGFPTANLTLGDHIRPRAGVYSVRVAVPRDLIDAEAKAQRPESDPLRSTPFEADMPSNWIWHDGVANIGTRPTVNGQDLRVEAHLFNFSGDLYGHSLRVALIDFLRPEHRFEGLEALQAQIALDCDNARHSLTQWKAEHRQDVV